VGARYCEFAEVGYALERLAANHLLSIDELCELARSADMNQALRSKAFRELVNETITAEQEREYMTYWATRPTEAATAMGSSANGSGSCHEALRRRAPIRCRREFRPSRTGTAR
jgi:hypothetical protein